jgi:hypothetical protein
VAVGIRATRIRAGRLCEQCCINIHLFGVGAAPYPRPARWRVTEGDVVQKLCEAHKDARCAAAT